MPKFEFIPAIDLLDGEVVRLYKGQYDKSTKYDSDPAAPVFRFKEAGASLIHLVDLNAARNGDRSKNKEALQKIRQAAKGLRLEIGGGVRNLQVIQEYFKAGVDRVVLGTAAVKDPAFLKEALAEYGGERIIVGVDALDGRVRVSGWEEDSQILVEDFLESLLSIGTKEIIFTDISRDGALSGPAIESLEALLESFPLHFIASGGVSSLEDVQNLKELHDSYPRLVGVISGRAIYDGRLDVAAAVQVCQGK